MRGGARAYSNGARRGRLPPLTHSEDPKASERLASGDGALATDDIADEYVVRGRPARGEEKSFEAISSTVTDDEFNSLFGPVQ